MIKQIKIKHLFLVFWLFLLNLTSISAQKREAPAMIKDSSLHNLVSKEKGFELIAVYCSPCTGDPYHSTTNAPKKIRIANKTFDENILTLEIATIANCCASFTCEIEVLENDTLHLHYEHDSNKDPECFCSCCFQLNYQIRTKKGDIKHFKLNNRPIIETDQEYQIEEGLNSYHPNGKRKQFIYKIDGAIRYIMHFDENGKKTSTEIYKDGILQRTINEK